MGVIIDSFDRANSSSTLGTTDTGQAWVAELGTWGISSNQAYNPTGDTGIEGALAVIDHGVSDLVITLDVTALPTNSTDAAICFRYTNNTNYYVAGIAKSLAGSYVAYCNRVDASTDTTEIAFLTGISQSAPWHLVVALSGTTITFYCNGVLVGTTTDSFNQTATRHGLAMYGTSLGRLDNYSTYAALSIRGEDAFNRANSATSLGTPDLGPAWVTSGTVGTWGISSNQAYAVSTATNGTDFATQDLGVAPVNAELVTLQATNAVVTEVDGYSAGIVFRYVDTNNFFRWITARPSLGSCYLQKCVAGSFSTIATVSCSPASGDILTVTDDGSTITCFRNAVSVATTTDSQFNTATEVGLIVGRGSTADNAWRLDNWSARTYDGVAYTQTVTDSVGIMDDESAGAAYIQTITDPIGLTDPVTAIGTGYDLEVLADSPSGYWKLDETSGTTATDSSGNGRNGTYVGSVTPGARSTVLGAAPDFTGGHVDLGDNAAFSPEAGSSGLITVEGLFLVDSTSTNQMLVTKGWSASGAAYEWDLRFSNADVLGLIFTSAGSDIQPTTASAAITTATLFHVVWTYDRSAQDGLLFVNGVQVAHTTSVVLGATASDTAAPLYIGARGDGAGSVLDGLASRIAIYDHVLSPTRVAAHYATITGTAYTQTVTDSLGLSDPASQTDTVAQAYLETLGLTDSISQAVVADRTITDSLGMTGSVTQGFVASDVIIDSLGLTDTWVAFITRSVTIADTLGSTDDVTRVASFRPAITSHVSLADSYVLDVTILSPQPPSSRWSLTDGSELWVFPTNPNAGGSPEFGRSLTTKTTCAPGGAVLRFEGRPLVPQSEIDGIVHTKEDLASLIDWLGRRHALLLTDDLGRSMAIVITDSSFKRAPHRHHPWRHTYNAKYLVLSEAELV